MKESKNFYRRRRKMRGFQDPRLTAGGGFVGTEASVQPSRLARHPGASVHTKLSVVERHVACLTKRWSRYDMVGTEVGR